MGKIHKIAGKVCFSLFTIRSRAVFYRDGTLGGRNNVFGVEYVSNTLLDYWSTIYQHDLPCAVCLVRNSSVVKKNSGRLSIRNLIQFTGTFCELILAKLSI